MKNIVIVTFLFFLLSCTQQTGHFSASGSKLPSNCDWQIVIKVYDGDTVKLENGTRVRYIGIDALEMNEDPVDSFAIQAAQENEKLVLHKKVCLTKDAQTDNEDKYGRLLRYIYREDGTCVNKKLIEEGLAKAYTVFPFGKVDEFMTAEKEAQNKQAGMWTEHTISNQNTNSPSLTPLQAKDYYGKNENVQFTVMSSHDSGKAIFLNSESNYKSADNFTVVIFYASKNTFIKSGINDPANYYLHKTIIVRGKIQKYQGKPEIIASSPASIVILP